MTYIIPLFCMRSEFVKEREPLSDYIRKELFLGE